MIELAFQKKHVISATTGKAVTQEELFSDLDHARMIYIGENHSDPIHHAIQLWMIQKLFARHPEMSIGMEMFDYTYQPILDAWTSAALDESAFLKKTHWYANWKFNFDLYRNILQFAQNNHIPVIGMNIPFHIPSKIAVGGLENLPADDRRHVPNQIDTSNSAHRAYIEEIFRHHRIIGRENFDDFYMTQCVWEEAMAQRLSENFKEQLIVVLAGNGHIKEKFGIPDRAFQRTHAPFRTICLISNADAYQLSYGDYIWITPE